MEEFRRGTAILMASLIALGMFAATGRIELAIGSAFVFSLFRRWFDQSLPELVAEASGNSERFTFVFFSLLGVRCNSA